MKMARALLQRGVIGRAFWSAWQGPQHSIKLAPFSNYFLTRQPFNLIGRFSGHTPSSGICFAKWLEGAKNEFFSTTHLLKEKRLCNVSRAFSSPFCWLA